MPYWMTNPEHGVMPVYDLGEVERAKGHGWEFLNEGPSPAKKVEPEEPGEVLEQVREAIKAMGVPPRRKPGPKPKVK